MARLIIREDKVRRLSREDLVAAINLCPFNAIQEHGGTLEINAGCKMCNICVEKGPEGAFVLVGPDEDTAALDKSDWKGIAVYIDLTEGNVHPVSLELVGKAKELAQKVGFPVYALIMGSDIRKQAEDILCYGVDEVFAYDYEELDNFLIEPYTNVFEDFIKNVRPSTILIGATAVGRSLAPRVAARMRTGLTADCTKLDIRENTDLIQIRPAFGGNIMAQIVTTNHRPQIATVRYKIFDAPTRMAQASGEVRGNVSFCEIPGGKLASRIKIAAIAKKEKRQTISDAEVIVAVGRGFKSKKDLAMAHELAELLGAEIATTRPLIEAGWVPPVRQIGLSGRTVKPKLIFTLGISGSVQFKAGMENSELIISVNTDANATIFDVSHIAVKGDIYDIVPKLTKKIKEHV